MHANNSRFPATDISPFKPLIHSEERPATYRVNKKRVICRTRFTWDAVTSLRAVKPVFTIARRGVRRRRGRGKGGGIIIGAARKSSKCRRASIVPIDRSWFRTSGRVRRVTLALTILIVQKDDRTTRENIHGGGYHSCRPRHDNFYVSLISFLSLCFSLSLSPLLKWCSLCDAERCRYLSR